MRGSFLGRKEFRSLALTVTRILWGRQVSESLNMSPVSAIRAIVESGSPQELSERPLIQLDDQLLLTMGAGGLFGHHSGKRHPDSSCRGELAPQYIIIATGKPAVLESWRLLPAGPGFITRGQGLKRMLKIVNF